MPAAPDGRQAVGEHGVEHGGVGEDGAALAVRAPDAHARARHALSGRARTGLGCVKALQCHWLEMQRSEAQHFIQA